MQIEHQLILVTTILIFFLAYFAVNLTLHFWPWRRRDKVSIDKDDKVQFRLHSFLYKNQEYLVIHKVDSTTWDGREALPESDIRINAEWNYSEVIELPYNLVVNHSNKFC